MCHEALNTPQQGIATAERWLARRGSDVPAVDLAAVQVALANSYLVQAAELDSRKQLRNQENAREQLLSAARIPGPHQATARRLLANLPTPTVSSTNATVVPGGQHSAEFVAAKSAADTVREQLQSTLTLWELQKRNLETAEEDDARQEAEALLAEAENNLHRFESSALEHYRQALAAVDESVDEPSINETRYMIAFLKYRQQRFLEAAAVAEFVAERCAAADPATSEWARVRGDRHGFLLATLPKHQWEGPVL